MNPLIIVIFIALLAVLFIGTPISLGIGFLGVAGILLFLPPQLMEQLALITYNQSTSMTTLMIPLYILMAEFLANSNIAADLFEDISRRLKKIPANLAVSSIVASALFSALCGSAPATAVTMGRISIPTMLKKGYNTRIAGGTQAAGGNLGILIPPSINLIIYGMITETSIAKLFIAGTIPGVVLALIMIAYVMIRSKVDPTMIVPPKEEVNGVGPQEGPSRLGDLLTVGPMLLLIIIIFVSLYTGLATATESAAIGAVLAAVIVVLQRRMSKTCIQKTLLNTASTTCMILFLMFGGLVFALFLTAMGLPQQISSFVLGASMNPWVIFIIVNIIFIILGCFLEPLSIMMIVLPFVFPFMLQLGFDPIWLGVVLTVNCAIGMITPPVGLNIFVLRGATGIMTKDIIMGVIPYIIIFTLFIVLLCFVP
ncbi:MAG: TRAP transporter large permease, partial [Clostridiales bacterium]|nr:TRAP transporter large permease [Clostridiales bacterium]